MFKTFCKNPVSEHDFLLRADQKSFALGIKFWYNGIENKPLANILYNFLGKGFHNHRITFSQFILLVREL